MLSELSIRIALQRAANRFAQCNIPAPQLTAEVLLSHLLNCQKTFLYAYPEENLNVNQQKELLDLVRQRCEGKPTQYITGQQEFYGFPFHVTSDVFIPRPETELLVEEALARLGGDEQLLDVGTGSGCVAIAIKKKAPATRVLACDISRPALRVAAQNTLRLGVVVEFVETDLVNSFAEGSFDLIVSNPPYVPLSTLAGLQKEIRFEPAVALFAGRDGLEVYEKLTNTAVRILRPGGWLLMELGYASRTAVEAMLVTEQWETPTVCTDLAGIDRMLAARKLSNRQMENPSKGNSRK